MPLNIAADRHPSVRHYAKVFDYAHLPPHLRDISVQLHVVAQNMVDHLADGFELTAGLRKLREAKDCFVLQAVMDRDVA